METKRDNFNEFRKMQNLEAMLFGISVGNFDFQFHRLQNEMIIERFQKQRDERIKRWHKN